MKGCVILAAFFMIAACQENSSDQAKENDQALSPIQSVEQKPRTDAESKLNSSQTNSKSPADSKPIADVFLTLNPKQPAETVFSCDDQIYLTIKFANHQPKLHQINISWKDPHGEERENNSFPFFVTQNESLAWASLKLHRSVGAGMLQLINPAAGMEEFIGEWTVEVKVGSIIDEKQKFEVLC